MSCGLWYLRKHLYVLGAGCSLTLFIHFFIIYWSSLWLIYCLLNEGYCNLPILLCQVYLYPFLTQFLNTTFGFLLEFDIVFFPSDLTPHHYVSSCFMRQFRIKLYFIWCKKSPSCLYSCSWVMVKLPLSWYFQFFSDFEFQVFANVCAYKNFFLSLLFGLLWV